MMPLSSFSVLALFSIAEQEEPSIEARDLPQNIKDQYQNLIEKIKQIQDYPIELQSNTILSDFLNLRVEMLKWLFSNENFDILFHAAFDEINFLKSSIKDKYLQDRLGRSNVIIEDITVSLMEELRDAVASEISFESVLQELSKRIQLDEETAKNFIVESVGVEYGIIVADLANSLTIKKYPDGLADFIYDKAQRYGAYSIIAGIWKPEENTNENEVLGCKMLAEIIRLEQGSGNSINLSDLPR